MDFQLSEEQGELVATVRALLAKRADSAAVRVSLTTDEGYDEVLWRLMCEQIGVAALAVPEQYDGFGATFFETAVVLEELGRSLAPSPLLATTIATEALLAGGTEDAKRELLPRIAAGEIATLALDDGPALDAAGAAIVLRVIGDDLVSLARVETTRSETVDQTIRLARVDDFGRATPVGDGARASERAELVGAACAAALAVGLCQRALDMTVAYAKERVQFGRPIGSFQALKHRMADMLARTEIARSVTWAAAYGLTVEETDADQVHAAAAYSLDAAADLAAECIQLHGGIAITWEHDAHMVFKRAHALRHLHGTPAEHRRVISL